MNTQLYNWYDEHERLRIFYKELLEENEVTQITITNCTDQSREITLWGTNKCAPIANPLNGEEQIKREADVGQISYEVVYNPVNDLFYVINFRTDTVTVVNDQAIVVQTVPLRADPLIPVNPNNIVVNTNPNSVEYGFVAISCTSEKEFITVDLNFTISRRIPLSNVPIDLVYNPVSDTYFLSEQTKNAVVQITTLSDQAVSFLTIAGVKTLGVNTDNGDLYVHNITDNNVDIYNKNGVKRGWFEQPTIHENAVSFYYHKTNQKMYITYDRLNTVLVTDTTLLQIETTLNIGNEPIDIAYNPVDNYIYIANQDTQNFTRVNQNHDIVDSIFIDNFDRSFAISSKNGVIALNNSVTNKLILFSKNQKLLVKVSADYQQIREDFKYNPMLIKHVKIVASTAARINTLQIIESSVSGKEFCESISLRSYQSPQSFGNVSEVFEMDGYIIDGRVCWRFTINPNQQVTFLIYYQQLEMYNFLPEKSRISTGVKMSKGIPQAWEQEN